MTVALHVILKLYTAVHAAHAAAPVGAVVPVPHAVCRMPAMHSTCIK